MHDEEPPPKPGIFRRLASKMAKVRPTRSPAEKEAEAARIQAEWDEIGENATVAQPRYPVPECPPHPSDDIDDPAGDHE